jgi:hypothetical protein
MPCPVRGVQFRQSYAPRRSAGFNGLSWNEFHVAASGTYLHAVAGALPVSGGAFHLYHARAPLLNGPVESIQLLNPDVWGIINARVDFDQNGTGMILSSGAQNGGLFHAKMYLTISRDDGATWLPLDSLTSGVSGSQYALGLAHDGHHWLAYWLDTTTYEGFVRSGLVCRLSANQGRSWYPAQQIEGERVDFGGPSFMDLHSNRVQFLMGCYGLNDVLGPYFVRWRGQIVPDTVAPINLSGTELPLVLPPDTTVNFLASAFDNDSLWRTDVILRLPHSADSLEIPLQRSDSIDYQAAWTRLCS